MACTITIISVDGEGPPGSPPIQITIKGTAEDCKEVTVRLKCAGDPVTDTAPVLDEDGNPADTGEWVVQLKILENAQCRCGEPVLVEAFCTANPECEAKPFEDPQLSCPQCPLINVTEPELLPEVGGCNPDGTRTVTLKAVVTPADGSVVAQWDYGDGALSVAFPVTGPLSEPHDYLPPGPYTAKLLIIVPTGCPAAEIPVGPLDECPKAPCPEVKDLTANVEGCAGSGSSATVTFTGTLSPPTSGCEFKWDFGDGSPDETTSSPTATHPYTEPGIKAVAVVAKCGECYEITPVSVTIPACCPVVTGVSGTVEGCADGAGTSATVTLVAATVPPSASGTYTWTFGDSSGPQTTLVPTVTHEYGEPGSKFVQVTFDPDEPGCEPSPATTNVSIPVCPDGDEKNGGTKCGSLVWAAVLALALGVILLALAGCLGIPWLAAVGGALVALYFVLIAIWLVLGWFNICAIDKCEAAAIHMGVLGPILAVLTLLLVWLPCINTYSAHTILSGVVAVWATIAASCLIKAAIKRLKR